MRSEIYFDRLIEAKGLKNDLGLAKYMGWSSGRMSQYRTGKRIMDNELCVRLAMELGMDNPMPIIMAADMDRAERAGQRSLWKVFSPRIATSAAATLTLVIGASVTNFVTPSTLQAFSQAIAAGQRFVLCKIRRRTAERLQQALRAIQARAEPAPA